MARFCAKCGKELKPGGKFCMSCGAPVQSVGDRNIRNESVKRYHHGDRESGNTYIEHRKKYTERKMTPKSDIEEKGEVRSKLTKVLVLLAAILVCIVFIKKICFTSEEALIGTWIVPGTSNQILEIRTEELRFNGRRYDYTVKGNVLYLEQTFPSSSKGKMPFKLRGDSLTIDLGTDFSGFFYGRSGTVELERNES